MNHELSDVQSGFRKSNPINSKILKPSDFKYIYKQKFNISSYKYINHSIQLHEFSQRKYTHVIASLQTKLVEVMEFQFSYLKS